MTWVGSYDLHVNNTIVGFPHNIDLILQASTDDYGLLIVLTWQCSWYL
jgi:hypothetical protein